MRLGVVSRAGIVLTGLWMGGATVYMTTHELNQWQDGTDAMQRICLEGASKLPPAQIFKAMNGCSDEARRSNEVMFRARSDIFWGSAGIAAVLAVLGWISGGIGFLLIRWILAGRTK